MLPDYKLGGRRIALALPDIVVVVLHTAEDHLLNWRCHIELPKKLFCIKPLREFAPSAG